MVEFEDAAATEFEDTVAPEEIEIRSLDTIEQVFAASEVLSQVWGGDRTGMPPDLLRALAYSAVASTSNRCPPRHRACMSAAGVRGINMDQGPIDPADPEYELKVAEWFQKTVNGSHEGDNAIVVVTVRQAQKITAIMGAVLRGHSAYNEALRDASWLLDCAVVEANPGPAQTSLTAVEAWARVEAWPWPRPGGPRENAGQ